MLCITHDSTDPWFNLAAEEYLLHNFSGDCFMLWRNDNTIVVGKHQNTLGEINMGYVRESNIKVARRLSGGGAVYHDLGNLNFTFIMNGSEGKLVDFKKYTQPVIEVLKNLSIVAEFSGKNNLTINGKKISGNAEHVYKKRVLHHGTLLFSSEMDKLSHALKVNPLKYQSKAVKSIRSRVTNIKDHLKNDMDVIQFRNMILEHIMTKYPGAVKYEFSNEDLISIKKLRDDKYRTWEWNFGYSPKYEFERSFMTGAGLVHVFLYVSGGIICKAKISGDHLNSRETSIVETLLEGTRHEETELYNKLETIPFPKYLQNISATEFIGKIF